MLKRIFKIISVLLVFALIGAGVGFTFKVKNDRKKITDSFNQTIKKIETILPNIYSGVLVLDKNASTMPKLSIDGTDYVGILEYEKGKRKFPIFADYSDSLTANVPARYYGDAESGTLVIGGRTEQGQFDFIDSLEVGDIFYVTDSSGNKYGYSLEKIEHLATTDYSRVFSKDYELSIFVKNGISSILVIRLKYGTN